MEIKQTLRVLVRLVPLLLLLADQCWCQDKVNRVVQLGNQLQASTSGIDTLPRPGGIFLMHDVNLRDGVVFAFSAFFRSAAPVRLQIWRPPSIQDALSNATTQAFTLLFELRTKPTVINRREDMYIESKIVKKCIRVKHGDRLGVHLEVPPGAVAYNFDKNQPAALSYTYGRGEAITAIMQTINFDLLKFPYDFSLAAYIDTDLRGYTNETEQDCPIGLHIPASLRPVLPTVALPTRRPENELMGATGAPGVDGVMGGTGPKGPLGYPGSAGIFGLVGSKGPGGLNGLPGNQGPMGPAGDEGIGGLIGVKGPPGYSGEVGLPGLPGRTGINGVLPPQDENALPVSATSTQGPDRLKVIIIAVWLIIISILIIILVIVLIMIKRRDKYAYRERLPSAGSDFKPSWMEVLGEKDAEDFRSEKEVKTAEVIPDNLPTYAFDNDAMS